MGPLIKRSYFFSEPFLAYLGGYFHRVWLFGLETSVFGVSNPSTFGRKPSGKRFQKICGPKRGGEKFGAAKLEREGEKKHRGAPTTGGGKKNHKKKYTLVGEKKRDTLLGERGENI